MKRWVILILALLSLSARAQDEYLERIIERGLNDNRTMDYDDFLSNRIGGRIVGSNALVNAEKWVAKQFESWGMEVMVQEVGEIAVGFERGPWFGRMISSDGGMTLHFGTPSYTSGTKGPQKGHVLIEPKNRREFDRMKGVLKGAWVLVDASTGGFAINSTEKADAERDSIISENETIERYNSEIRQYNREHPEKEKPLKALRTGSVLFYREMIEAGVLGFIQSAEVPMQIHYDRANCFNLTMETLPTVCDIHLDASQYEIIYRKAKQRDDFALEFDIRNHFYEGPVKYHNVIGIIRGKDFPDQYVLTGGHLDAYDNATGSVDDAHGVSVVMESARLIALSGVKPARTMMFCVWTGEEYGLLGSKYFVQNKTIPLENISNYLNRDGGPLCAMGVTVPPAMYDDFVRICKPLADLSADFPFTVTKREGEPGPVPTRAGGSDHAHFAVNGVPTIKMNEQDPKGYNFEYRQIWHTDRDLFYQVIPEYVEFSALANAVVLYGIANLDHQLSREGLYKEETKKENKKK